jgi:hypothetical protein
MLNYLDVTDKVLIFAATYILRSYYYGKEERWKTTVEEGCG